MDMAKPITPGDAIRYAVSEVRAKIHSLEVQRDAIAAKIEALTAAAWDMESNADRFDKYQPKPAPSDPSPSDAPTTDQSRPIGPEATE